jgi:hypothetical protein
MDHALYCPWMHWRCDHIANDQVACPIVFEANISKSRSQKPRSPGPNQTDKKWHVNTTPTFKYAVASKVSTPSPYKQKGLANRGGSRIMRHSANSYATCLPACSEIVEQCMSSDLFRHLGCSWTYGCWHVFWDRLVVRFVDQNATCKTPVPGLGQSDGFQVVLTSNLQVRLGFVAQTQFAGVSD